MRKLTLALAAATSLTMASAANAAITLGAANTTGVSQTVNITENVLIPNQLQFDTRTNASGNVSSYFDFQQSYASFAVFSVTAATSPASSITLIEVLTGAAVQLFATPGNGGNSLTLQTGNLLANTTYRFQYGANMGSAGSVSGNATFYPAVPEPATWGMMLLGFGGIGFAMRRRRQPALAQLA